MTYTPTNAYTFRTAQGTRSEKLASEFSAISTQFGKSDIKYALITGHIGTRTAAATTGVDVATGSDATYYGAFFAPVALTLTTMYVLVNEAYVKDTTDAVVAIKDNAGTPVTRFTKTMTAAGDDAGDMLTADVVTGQSTLAAGTRLDLAITATASSTGTGHVDVIIGYKVA